MIAVPRSATSGARGTIDALGERARDRRILIGGRGVAERRGAMLAWRGPALAGFALPFDLTASSVVGGAMVLDGAAALVELDRGGQRTALVYDLRRGEVRSRIRLGDASIMAIAERKGLVVLGRGSSVALFDLRAGSSASTDGCRTSDWSRMRAWPTPLPR